MIAVLPSAPAVTFVTQGGQPRATRIVSLAASSISRAVMMSQMPLRLAGAPLKVYSATSPRTRLLVLLVLEPALPKHVEQTPRLAAQAGNATLFPLMLQLGQVVTRFAKPLITRANSAAVPLVNCAASSMVSTSAPMVYSVTSVAPGPIMCASPTSLLEPLPRPS